MKVVFATIIEYPESEPPAGHATPDAGNISKWVREGMHLDGFVPATITTEEMSDERAD